MTMRMALIMAVGSLLAATMSAAGDWPPPFWQESSIATTAAPAGAAPVLFSRPDGAGAAFTQARTTGGVVNATITLTMLEVPGVPIPGIAATDMWLEREIVANTGNFVACDGGTLADRPTDAAGVTHWTRPLRAGGWSTAKTLVVVWGSALASNTGLVLRHNSADLNGDRVVNLSDVPLFAGDFAGSYHFRSDLLYDGVVNLSDIPRLAAAVGADCP